MIQKVAVIGAGAIGGLVGARLAMHTNHEITLFARGEHLKAMKQRGGILLIEKDGKTRHECSNVRIIGDWAEMGQFDVIFITVKAYALVAIAPFIPPLCKKNTVIVPLQNGIPWWYFYKNGGPYDGCTLKSIDPDGILAKYIPNEMIVGCIAFPAAEIAAPGIIKHVEGRALPLGEPDRSISPRAQALQKMLESATFLAPIRTDFREEIWFKLLGNICFNPLSALTGASLSEIALFEPSYQLCYDVMNEVKEIALALNCKMRHTVEYRINKAKNVGNHTTSMLQDVLHDKTLEVELLTIATEIAEMLGMEKQIPCIRVLKACILLANHTMELKRKSKL